MRTRRNGSQWNRLCGDCGKPGHKAGQCAAEAAFRARLAELAAKVAGEKKAPEDKPGG